MKSNFEFLQAHYPMLFRLGNLAETYLYSDANSCLIKLGMFGETVVNIMLKLDSIPPPEFENTHANRIRLLKNNDLIPSEIDNILYSIRSTRNHAIHANYESTEKCKTLLQMAHTLGLWFMQSYADANITTPVFSLPQEDIKDYKLIVTEQEKYIQELATEIDNIKASQVPTAERINRGRTAAAKIHLSEKETRYLIDEQLRKVGWEADTENLRYSKGTRPEKNRKIAIAEWPTISTKGNRNAVDYAFFVGLELIAVAEAKRSITDISAYIDTQCKDYAKNIRQEDEHYIINNWNDYKVPFIFATNGRKYLKQIETKSGTWFLDVRKESNIPKALQAWPSPSGIMEWLNMDVDKANETLQNTSTDFLKDPSGLNLRDYQIQAIDAVENAIIDNKSTALVAMATGTGKTRTILGLMYRLLESNRCKRILFLVDRNYLGTQAQDVFADVKVKDFQTLKDIYDTKMLEDKNIDLETRVHVATVQSLVQRIMYSDDTAPAVSDYDLIIIDEAHRGYVLDKQMDDAELQSLEQSNYISIYRTVVEYFNATKIALTATPALHTTQIFGKPIYSYTYRDAVVDGFLVDHNAPHIIKTKLSTAGIHYAKGETLAIYDPHTGEVTNSDELEDELHFDVAKFNKQVITENFNREALKEIAKNLNPEDAAKTLIFAANDSHADLVVKLLREHFEAYDLHQDAIQKITGSIGDQKRIREAVRKFKNETYPNIVVTVDLLTTGIDVPSIANLVFLRRVRSRILFEQMLGRATRLCGDFKKEFFEIYDAVGVYSSLEPVSGMKPVVADPKLTVNDLLTSLETCTDEEHIKAQIDKVIAKIRRKSRNMTEKQYTDFTQSNNNEDVTNFANHVKSLSPTEAKAKLLEKKQILRILDEGGGMPHKPVVISDKEDKLTEHTRGYGNDLNQKPEDYLEEFQNFIKDNAERIEALHLVCTRPASLTRQSLITLRRELDAHGYTEARLQTAWNEAKNEDIVADLIGFVRSYAHGTPLFSREARIKSAIAKLKKAHNFDKIQQNWLDRIATHLLTESVLNKDTFNLGAFKAEGGFNRINKFFQNKLEDYITELNTYLYDDGEKVA